MTRKAGREYKRSKAKSSTSTMINQALEDRKIINAGDDDITPIYDSSNTRKNYDEYLFGFCEDSFLDDDSFFDDDETDWTDNSSCLLIEDSWRPGDSYNYNDKGIGYLRYVMEDVKPSEVHTKDLRWVAGKYNLISAMIATQLLSPQFLESEDGSIFGRYSVQLEKMLRIFGIEFKILGGITDQGWETFKNLHGESCTA